MNTKLIHAVVKLTTKPHPRISLVLEKKSKYYLENSFIFKYYL